MSQSNEAKTSNEDFISFSFSVVSVLLICLYVPKMLHCVRALNAYWKAPKKSRGPNPLMSIWEYCAFLPSVAFLIATKPRIFFVGVQFAFQEKMYFLVHVAPKFFSSIMRPRIFLPLLWLLLFSSVMYSSLTFDPHAILNIPKSASASEVKKAYRSLARQYHPDINGTEEARALFIQARRAYKALVDREAFEEEEMKTAEFSVGIALPHFLLSRKHDGLVIFGLLGILVFAPLYVCRKFFYSNNVKKLVDTILLDAKYTEMFMKRFGIPGDFKTMEKRISRELILFSLVQLGLVPKYATVQSVAKFPPLPDFIQRCVDAEHQKNFLEALGFNETTISTLKGYMITNGEALLKKYEAQISAVQTKENVDLIFEPNFNFKVTMHFYCQHRAEIDKALNELIKINDGIPSAKKLLRLHEEAQDNLQYIFLNGVKKNRSSLTDLIQTPQKVEVLVESIQQEILLVYRRHYRTELAKSISKKELKAYKKRATMQQQVK